MNYLLIDPTIKRLVPVSAAEAATLCYGEGYAIMREDVIEGNRSIILGRGHARQTGISGSRVVRSGWRFAEWDTWRQAGFPRQIMWH